MMGSSSCAMNPAIRTRCPSSERALLEGRSFVPGSSNSLKARGAAGSSERATAGTCRDVRSCPSECDFQTAAAPPANNDAPAMMPATVRLRMRQTYAASAPKKATPWKRIGANIGLWGAKSAGTVFSVLQKLSSPHIQARAARYPLSRQEAQSWRVADPAVAVKARSLRNAWAQRVVRS